MKKFALSLLLSSLLGICQAQMYVELSLGATNATPESSSNTNLTRGKPAAGSWGLGLGYKLAPNVAVVAKYQSLYAQDVHTATTEQPYYTPEIGADAVSLRIVGILPLNNQTSVNAKLGFGRTKMRVNDASSTHKLNYGVGLDYSFDQKILLGLDLDFYPTNAIGTFPAFKQVNLGIVSKYRFD
jgi:hypothetical protein